MLGRAAKAIGRAFGSKEEAAPAVTVPAPRKRGAGDNPPRAGAAAKVHAAPGKAAGKQAAGKRTAADTGRGKTATTAPQRGSRKPNRTKGKS
jgi:ribonuclease R